MSTKTPAVMDALVVLFTNALPNVTILDGPAGARTLRSDVATIGLAAEDFHAADIEQVRLPGMGDELEESFSITCAVSSSTGGTTYKPARDRCLAMLTAVRTAVRADETLARLVNLAWVNVRSLDQGFDNGAYVDITFTVDGRDYL